MRKTKYLLMILFIGVMLFILPNISSAAEVTVTRDVYSNNGSMKFEFKGLTLDKTHEYEFGLTQTAVTKVETWHLIAEYTETTASVDIVTTTKDLREVVNAVDTGYITIKDKTSDKVILEPYSVNLKIPFLRVTNYTVIPNGKGFGIELNDSNLQIGLRCASNSKAYYQYEKIVDENIINKYKEIKAKNGDVTEIENMLKTTTPSSNWNVWALWTGYDSFTGMNGYGYPQKNITVNDSGLYYLWVNFSGSNVKDIYGYVLVDNLEPEVALESIALPKTRDMKLGENLTLTVTFNPETATNKIITWSSSDETVATVDNTGKVTPKKIGSTIITATSKDGNKKATCTVNVVAATNNSQNNNAGTNNGNNNNSGTNNDSNNSAATNNVNNKVTNNVAGTKVDNTISVGKLPQTGVKNGMIFVIIILIIASLVAYSKFNKYRGL